MVIHGRSSLEKAAVEGAIEGEKALLGGTQQGLMVQRLGAATRHRPMGTRPGLPELLLGSRRGGGGGGFSVDPRSRVRGGGGFLLFRDDLVVMVLVLGFGLGGLRGGGARMALRCLRGGCGGLGGFLGEERQGQCQDGERSEDDAKKFWGFHWILHLVVGRVAGEVRTDSRRYDLLPLKLLQVRSGARATLCRTARMGRGCLAGSGAAGLGAVGQLDCTHRCRGLFLAQ